MLEKEAVFPLWLVFAPGFRNWIKVSRIGAVPHIGRADNIPLPGGDAKRKQPISQDFVLF